MLQVACQQIKLLKNTLQITLFERRGRSIKSTEAADLLARYVEAVCRVTKQEFRDRINLNVSPCFGTHYPLPAVPAVRFSRAPAAV